MDTITNMAADQIRAELNRLSESLPGQKQAKAALFNLIVYTHEPHRTQYFRGIADTILEQFACRLIFIEADIISKESVIRVNVSLSSNTNDGANADEIYIQASGNEIERIPFLIFPHLISDLPIYLLWGQDPSLDTTILPRIQPLATRIIFDSEVAEKLNEFCQTVLDLIDNSYIEIVDMNWMRISGWRQIVSRAFDTGTRIGLLCKTSYMKIVYNTVKDSSFIRPETQAVYLQAWIASCLGWKYDKIEVNSDQKITLHYKGSNHDVKVDLIPQMRKDLAEEEIIEWELCDPNNYDCIFNRVSMTQVNVKASNQYQCLLPFSFVLPSLHSGRSLMQEIFYKKISDHYTALLKLISQIKWDK